MNSDMQVDAAFRSPSLDVYADVESGQSDVWNGDGRSKPPGISGGHGGHVDGRCNDGKSFKQWIIYDPNHPGDQNYASYDANTTLMLTLMSDMSVEGHFKCGGALAPPLLGPCSWLWPWACLSGD